MGWAVAWCGVAWCDVRGGTWKTSQKVLKLSCVTTAPVIVCYVHLKSRHLIEPFWSLRVRSAQHKAQNNDEDVSRARLLYGYGKKGRL